METENDYIDRFVKEVVSKGPEALLPQNLTQEWLDILLEEADQLEELDSDQDFPKILLAAVLHILFHHKGDSDKIEVTEKELLDYIERYVIAIAGEKVTRETDIGIEPPTLNSVLRGDRKVIAYKK